MTTKAKFPAVDFQASKLEEIAWLKEAAAAVAPGTYLAGLLNPRLIEFFQTQAENDFPTDIMDYYQYEKKCAQERGEELRKVRAELDKAEVDFETALAEQRKSWELTLEAEKASTKFWQESADKWQELYNNERELYNGMVNKLGAERDAQAYLESALEQAEHKIIKLKAKLYDLMMAA